MKSLAFAAALLIGTAAMAQTPPPADPAAPATDMAAPAGTASDMPAPAADAPPMASPTPTPTDTAPMATPATAPTSAMPPAGDPSTYPKCTRKITDRCVNPGGK